jgi:hypothetical protein
LYNPNLQTQSKKKFRWFYAVILIAILVMSLVSYYFFFYVGPGPVEIAIKTEKGTYLQGETIAFNIYVVNNQNWRVYYPTFKEFLISNGTSFVWGTASGVTDVYVGPSFALHSRTLYETIYWDQKMNGDILAQVPSGNYSLTVNLMDPYYHILGTSIATFEIKASL